ncbi:MAG: bifunctional adenosylcobinamide kinase/adenosylcobinamide-phosphate guanylyltransferase [Oscillospiraceae bacterium]|nr:bifunctional adenosylcobinamide kinase/adenosylcobinamide-phosphate guanylyltransferase [Oscillospiraceae bacterium]
MIFVTGPLFAGKQDYICAALGWTQEMFDAHGVRDVERLAEQAGDLPTLADALAAHEVVIATEIGGGVVPVDAGQREARERAGRLACQLAQRAEVVVRVCCGLPQVLKGKLP